MGFKLVPAAIACAIGLVIWFVIPAPEGVTANAWHLLALFVATIAAIIGKAMPIGALAVLAITMVALTGVTNDDPSKAIGDALSSADPVSGAGMTKAFLEVGVLRDLLGHADMRDKSTAQAFYRRVSRLTDTIWSVIREQNLRYPWIRDVARKRPPWAGLQNWYVDRLMEAMHDSPDLYRLYMSVSHFVLPPTALMRPGVVLRVVGKWLGARLSFRPTLIERTFGARPPVVPAPRSGVAGDSTTPT